MRAWAPIGSSPGTPIYVGSGIGVGGAVGQAQLTLDVTEKLVGKVEFLRESAVLLHRVEAHTQDLDALGGHLVLSVAQRATLDGSAGCVGLGVEPQQNLLAPEVRQSNGVPLMVLHLEVRRAVSDL